MTSEKDTVRSQWGSKFGFLMAAIGSAVGLGNLWGFPYKMGKSGGGAFLIVYLALVLLVGVVIMLGELALGRRTGKGAVEAYQAVSKKFAWVGYMGVAAPFLILTFYNVLGGMVLKYMFAFIESMFSGGANFANIKSGAYFGAFICNGPDMLLYLGIFMLLNVVIVMSGVEGGIERFNKYAIPALAVILVGLAAYVYTFPGAEKGLDFMFRPDFAVFSDPEIGFFKVLKTAAGQMFFSLSLGMGVMITYGSYLSKDQDLSREMYIVPLADTIIAVLAGMVVMPACFAFGLAPAGGPSLLFVSLHEVFVTGMGGFSGSFVGFLFYFLTFLAAISSSMSLFEVCVAYVLDRQVRKGKAPRRILTTVVIAAVLFVVSLPVALDGLGSNVAGGAAMNSPGVMLGLKKIPMAFDCWLDFFDMLSEGVMMPLGSLVMSIMFGWVVGTKFIADEVALTPGKELRCRGLVDLCFKVIVPVILVVVLWAQLQEFGLI